MADLSDPRRNSVIVVDDDADIRGLIVDQLRQENYDLLSASNLAELRQALREQPVDLIVLDLELPGLTGFEAAKRLRATPETAAIPLIAATGYSHERQLALARQSGFDAVVVKPCDPDMLVHEIERLLPAEIEGFQPNHSRVEVPHNNG